jgi:hypothetical protein
MLRDFVDLKPGDWVLQNGANSAVSQVDPVTMHLLTLLTGRASGYSNCCFPRLENSQLYSEQVC